MKLVRLYKSDDVVLNPEEGTGRVFSPMVTHVQLWGGTRCEWLRSPLCLAGL